MCTYNHRHVYAINVFQFRVNEKYLHKKSRESLSKSLRTLITPATVYNDDEIKDAQFNTLKKKENS